MMLSLCFAPIILAASLTPVSTSWHSSSLDHAFALEAQTCNQGLGAHARATTNDIYTGSLQYGFMREHRSGFQFSLIPRFGVSHNATPVRNLPATVQYALEAEALVCYHMACSGISYLHMSNGRAMGMCPSGDKCAGNTGEDIISIKLGYRFH